MGETLNSKPEAFTNPERPCSNLYENFNIPLKEPYSKLFFLETLIERYKPL